MTASATPQPVPASMIARNITNLANQPAKIGTPASEAMNAVIVTASTGEVWNSPAYDEISALCVRRATAITTANAPRFMAPYTNRYTTTAAIALAATWVLPLAPAMPAAAN